MTEIYILEIDMNSIVGLSEVLTKYISNESRNRILSYMIPQKSYQTLITEILIRYIIMKKNIQQNNEIRICRNEYGKPYLETEKNFHFNCSHSENWIVCAVSTGAVGIDIEAIKYIDLNVGKRFFSESEYAYINNAPPNLKLNYFYDLWTLKEAYIKKIGKGLNMRLKDFSICFDKNKIYVESAKYPENCYFYKYDIIKNFKMSLCTSIYQTKCPIIFIRQEHLINDFIDLINTKEHNLSSLTEL
ncbi:4'-phosphopantetheinyl transferase family protein [Lutispora saccharofermentans]|uniref:4'-phosphopantetheinyl transferase superfamily protein n=1 Tax=Lutispora saccharofermentans TaxID=3024236 RepID=A0ABT1NIP0_9FIRM|nr:4'-phosphopantetheinyl transferase superfamily protein [Lutispora saccharofermentans]MCQ1531145.1 4'-phosphopantetheinyl transferase superfamily protein [Lutispora saccharofermentans]